MPDVQQPPEPVILPVQTVRFNGQRYKLSMVFEPMRSPDGYLVAVELLSRLTDVHSDALTLPPDIFYAHAVAAQLRKALRAQVNCLRLSLPWLSEHGVIASLNINQTLASLIVRDPWLKSSLSSMQPWLRFEISEHFLQAGGEVNDDRMLKSLRDIAPLWLDDFGTGSASLVALIGRRFEALKLDVALFIALTASQEGRGLLMSLNQVARLYDARLIAEGVETPEQHLQVGLAGLWAGQGWLWPAIRPEGLSAMSLRSKV